MLEQHPQSIILQGSKLLNRQGGIVVHLVLRKLDTHKAIIHCNPLVNTSAIIGVLLPEGERLTRIAFWMHLSLMSMGSRSFLSDSCIFRSRRWVNTFIIRSVGCHGENVPAKILSIKVKEIRSRKAITFGHFTYKPSFVHCICWVSLFEFTTPHHIDDLLLIFVN